MTADAPRSDTSQPTLDPIAVAKEAVGLESTPTPGPAPTKRPRATRRRARRAQLAELQQQELQAWAPAPGAHRASTPTTAADPPAFTRHLPSNEPTPFPTVTAELDQPSPQQKHLDTLVARTERSTAEADRAVERAERLSAEADAAVARARASVEAMSREATHASEERARAERDVLQLVSHVRLSAEEARDLLDRASELTSEALSASDELKQSGAELRERLENLALEARRALATAHELSQQADEARSQTVRAERFAEQSANARRAAEDAAVAASRDAERAHQRSADAAAKRREIETEHREVLAASARTLQELTDHLAECRHEVRRAAADRVSAEQALAGQVERTTYVQEELTRSLEQSQELAQRLLATGAEAAASNERAAEAHTLRQAAENDAASAVQAAERAHRRAEERVAETSSLHTQMHQQSAELRELLERSRDEVESLMDALREATDNATQARQQILTQAQARVEAEARARSLQRRLRWLPIRRAVEGLDPSLDSIGPTARMDTAPRLVAVTPQEPATSGETLTLAPPRSPAITTAIVLVTIAAASLTVVSADPVWWAAAGLAGLLIWWRLRSERFRTVVRIRGSVAEIQRAGAHHVFDLADPSLKADLVSVPDSPTWKVVFHRRGLQPVVLSRRDVDAHRLTEEFARWQRLSS